MRLAELSERSGVPTATIKYYLRERLLPPGERITATTSEYGEEHLRRLRLVRSLIQVGRMPVATAREVLEAAEDESLSQNTRMGAAVWALPHGPEPDEDDPHAARAREQVDTVLRRMDWSYGQELGDTSPAYRMLVAAIASLDRLGYPHDTEHLLVHARLAGELAVADLDLVETYDTPPERIEAVVALTVLYEPVLLSLRRLAQTEESGRRFAE
ncbi:MULTISPECIES: MerR family transcriptional regulator [Streptomyces]|uniref:MerR family transcriptional regulator n=4 Tax=Streptomyces TaxID=1883 RepID=A0ABD5JCP3_9ACTN|nr:MULTISPECIES: MerR family transcriptional regulator [Streptomyces]MEE4585024.1 MerR family transcriptional regulator [Streptomyces sp. DSM 41602]AJZ82909.1 MerR family transcriptional regulator [Streptomyces sp. AgN23]KUL61970.1 transcriptional regulator [Streptomyces violaceusniger]RSS38277.1 MerR family transcriptional regulator [Streptomyces sp. WAC05858]WTA84282.1 MerR family transcriptional regulator [Streptomyces antimycoticus]